VSAQIRKAAKIEKGSGTPNAMDAGKITKAQVKEIAQKKIAEMTAASLDAAMKTVAGTARSMGVVVEG
jgi:large subunit ribosomal protein L11